MRWATTTDWVAAREDAEDAALRVWARVTGGEAPAQTAARVGAAAGESAVAAAEVVRREAGEAAGATGEFLQGTAAEAKEAGVSIWERGFRKGKELAEEARSAVGVAEEKAQVKTRETRAEWANAVQEEDAEKIIEQRYAAPEVVLSRSAEEILEDRLKPDVDQFSVKAPGA